jgi:hypothetical protein
MSVLKEYLRRNEQHWKKLGLVQVLVRSTIPVQIFIELNKPAPESEEEAEYWYEVMRELRGMHAETTIGDKNLWEQLGTMRRWGYERLLDISDVE